METVIDRHLRRCESMTKRQYSLMIVVVSIPEVNPEVVEPVLVDDAAPGSFVRSLYG